MSEHYSNEEKTMQNSKDLAGKDEQSVISHIDQIRETMQKVGIPTTTRKHEDHEYLFIGAPEDAECLLGMDDNFETTRLDDLLIRHKYFEFENGNLVSWSAS